ncbi:hypothetical protein ES332_D06G030900v1 [Gossypium tomentosum]|uniref:Uncharacterized protein n=1 Tax=Gossypium tomentosum TaxID=34277 RepID=A0A5D2KDL1_GOSTO|nr:hypothetical protein ES332_D06G030900v1 [Gossypium tomentosum]
MLNGGDGSPRLWPLLDSGFASHMFVSPFGSILSSHPLPFPVISNDGRKFMWLRFAYFRFGLGLVSPCSCCITFQGFGAFLCVRTWV